MIQVFVLLLACSDKEEAPTPVDGDSLIEEYNSVYCDLLSDPECVQGFAQCGEQMTLFTDWSQCMNSQNLVTGNNCAHLRGVFEDNSDTVQSCIRTLSEQQCSDNLCTSNGTIIQESECGQVLELIVQNCSIF